MTAKKTEPTAAAAEELKKPAGKVVRVAKAPKAAVASDAAAPVADDDKPDRKSVV